VFDKPVELIIEPAIIEQMEPLVSGHLSGGVLRIHSLRSPSQDRPFVALSQLYEFFFYC
jgi:hypothetical protein